jgi:hypothetical protein
VSVFLSLLHRSRDPVYDCEQLRVDEDRLVQLERREKSLWKANSKMRRVYQDVEKLQGCVKFFMDHEPCLNDTILGMLPREFGGTIEYSDSDLREFNPWWHKEPLPHEVI